MEAVSSNRSEDGRAKRKGKREGEKGGGREGVDGESSVQSSASTTGDDG